jgi:lycopene beta-cyclase
MQEYDYIFVGVGLSSLVLLNKLFEDNLLKDKRILLMDPDLKNESQKHICFWNTADAPLLNPYVEKSWRGIKVVENSYRKASYSLIDAYKLLNFSKFKRAVIQKLESLEGTVFIHKAVRNFDFQRQILTDEFGNSYRYNLLFNSVGSSEAGFMQQFVGFVIETEEDSFNPDEVTLMDFTAEPQSNAIEFEYVLPYNSHKALVEYTLLTKKMRSWQQLENILSSHLSRRFSKVKILEKEQGAIPMENKFSAKEIRNVIQMGISAGMQRASTGYLLNQAIDYSNQIAESLKRKETIQSFQFKRRVAFYDKVFLRVMKHYPADVPGYFYNMFLEMKADNMLRFMSGKTSVKQELKLIQALPKLRFMKCAIYEWLGI